ncbi:hypothetical protein ACFL18_02080 [Patescibacteria group bacterium]
MKKILTGLLIVLGLVLVGASCDKDSVKEMTSGLTGETAMPDGWVEYKSETHKFSFNHPSAWVIVPEINKDSLLTMKLLLIDKTQAERENELTGGMMPSEYWITFRVEDNPDNMSAKDFGVKQYLSQSKAEMKAKFKDYSLNGVEGYTDSGPVTPPSSGNWTQVSLGPKNGKAYSFVYYAAAHPDTHKKYLEEFYQILETLEFVK